MVEKLNNSHDRYGSYLMATVGAAVMALGTVILVILSMQERPLARAGSPARGG